MVIMTMLIQQVIENVNSRNMSAGVLSLQCVCVCVCVCWYAGISDMKVFGLLPCINDHFASIKQFYLSQV